MSLLLTLWFLITTSPQDVESLRASAPSYLTVDDARTHLACARAAGAVHHLDASVLLAIAYRESRYTPGTRGPEVRGKHACGLMQPRMHNTPCPRQTVLDGYQEGAEHLREWADTQTCGGDLRCAVLGYSGGYSLLRGCQAGPVVVDRGGRPMDLCRVPDLTYARAARLSRTRDRASSSAS